MKKRFALLLCIALLFSMTGCSGKKDTGSKTGSQTQSVSDVLEAGMAAEDGPEEEQPAAEEAPEEVPEGPAEEASEPEEEDAAADGIDVDLTVMSATMVYSEVNDMMISPENYIGKTVKMEGDFAVYYDGAADVYYYACIVKDATECCSQGIEFVLADAGERKFPEDYPVEGQDITVIGVFDTYQDGDFQYCTLREAKLV